MAGWTQRVRASQQIGFNLFHAHRFLVAAALSSRTRQACAALLLLPILAFGQAQMATPGSLQVDPQGSASYTVPIQITPGTAGMVPVIALQYRSGAGNGLVGNSWGIRGLNAITRCGRSIDRDGISAGVHFDATDKFCMDGSVLVAISGVDADRILTHP